MWHHVIRSRISRSGTQTWIVPGALLACRYPHGLGDLNQLAQHGITLVVNLHERPHPASAIERIGLREIHLSVPDFTPPSPEQLRTGVRTITDAIEAGECVAVHCGAGLGRTGTLLACYLASRGATSTDAIRRIRELRPGSIETPAQEQAVHDYVAASRA